MYNPKKIEAKWQKIWAKDDFKVWHADDKAREKKIYILDMFPYPSGEGLHVGHVEGYTASDIISRYYRMKGMNVLHPMGWDAFGLPAENYAIKKKIHPSIVVRKNVKNFTKQLRSLGFSYDWQREINTTDAGYYKWTQWIFLQLFKQGLAYEAEVPVNWCPSCKTVLANEEVIDDRCDRCQSLVERKKLKQWILKITAYADRLLEDLEMLDWPDKVKEMQKNWIGKSEGAEIDFHVSDSNLKVRVFTTRADTLPGATYIVLAPEHEIITLLNARIVNKSAVDEYIDRTKHKSDLERQAESQEKTGVEIKGITVINPFTKKEIPVWISDYVLGGYGTGAVMAVPAHDDRDFAHAKAFNLPIVQVVSPDGNRAKAEQSSHDGKENPDLQAAFTGGGVMINAGDYNNLPNHIAKDRIVEFVGGKKKINYKLRDWIFSRQRYWGEPIPVIKCPQCGTVPVPEDQLPVELPKVKNYEPTGEAESPLAGIKKWVNVDCPQCKGPAKRETNTMPQWAGSCWYYLRYLDSKNAESFADRTKEKYWMPVDIYIGGVEHAVLHLLYARFWHKVLFDIGVVSTKEPFHKLMNQGLILGPDGQKMSKSRGNVINPDDMIERFGADALRLYEMFMGPLEDAKPWQPDGIIGLSRFLTRVNNLVLDTVKADRKKNNPVAVLPVSLEKLFHKTVKKVTGDIELFRFNTAISAMMILLNEIDRSKTGLPAEYCRLLVKMLAPFAPHLSQEIWQKLGHETMLDDESWPSFDEKMTVDNEVDLLVQVNGRLRDKLTVPAAISQEEAEKLALASAKVQEFTGKKKPAKIIFVPGKLINIVVQ